MELEQQQHITRLIDNLELCHHKAERHVDLILQAICEGWTAKGYQAHETTSTHPATAMWRNAITVLEGWLTGETAPAASLNVGSYTGKALLDALGARTELKAWQVQQVVSKLKHASRLYPDAKYAEMVDYPERYADCQAHRDQTVDTLIHDTRDSEPALISLAAAIDHLQPCNWNFPANLMLVLRAIAGNLHPDTPFAAHGRNVRLNPIRTRMQRITETLRAFHEESDGNCLDLGLLVELGEPTAEKTALTQQLEAKIRDVFFAGEDTTLTET